MPPMEQTNKQYFEQLKKLLGEIYEAVVLEALVNKSGICWETITSIREKNAVERGVKYGISNGTTGIALFLIEYYKFSPLDEVRDVIKRSLLGAFTYYNNSENSWELGFYNGRGGLIYTLVQAYGILGEHEFLSMARKLIKLPVAGSRQIVFNLNSGVSGYLLGILHYYQATNDKSILSVIAAVIETLISGVKIKKQGIFWDELYFSSGPLCSFMYGNSGIVFLLIELKKRFDIPGLDKIICEAIAFEDSFYDEKTWNWPDYSNENIEINVRKLSNGSAAMGRRTSVSTFSWSVGSPGTLLARHDSAGRSRSFENSYEASCRYLQDCSASSDFTLYNGLGGILLSCLSIDANFGFSLGLLLAQKSKFGYLRCGYRGNRAEFDLSLFRGEAGIGYLILKTLFNRGGADTVLFPAISKVNYNVSVLTLGDLSFLPFKNILPHIDFSSQRACIKEKTYFDLATMAMTVKYTVNDIDDFLRREKFKMLQEDIDFLGEFIKLTSLPRDTKIPGQIKLGCNCKVVEFEGIHLLLIRRIGDVEVHELSEMQYIILSLCDLENGIRGKDVFSRILEAVEVDEFEVELLANSTTRELIFWFQFGVLVKPPWNLWKKLHN
jgi:hypothetical protein